jgi:hypothetical protein
VRVAARGVSPFAWEWSGIEAVCGYIVGLDRLDHRGRGSTTADELEHWGDDERPPFTGSAKRRNVMRDLGGHPNQRRMPWISE